MPGMIAMMTVLVGVTVGTECHGLLPALKKKPAFAGFFLRAIPRFLWAESHFSDVALPVLVSSSQPACRGPAPC